MSELINFRDFGGLPTKQGKTIKKGIFYRSGSYRDLQEEDREFIRSLGIENLCDYREAPELDRDEKHETFANRVHKISASEHLGAFDHDRDVAEVLLSKESMEDFYRKLPFENPAYRNMMEILKDPNNVPFLHNCTAGKDRTGVATALIQKLLHANEEAILLDYMRSMDAYEQILENEYRRLNGRNKCDIMGKLSGLAIMPSYLEAAFEAILNKYGCFDDYFEVEYGIDETLRNKMITWYTE